MLKGILNFGVPDHGLGQNLLKDGQTDKHILDGKHSIDKNISCRLSPKFLLSGCYSSVFP